MERRLNYGKVAPAASRALANQFAKLAGAIRSAIQQSTELGDPTTADLFTEISRSLDKDLWFLEAHLQKKS